MRTPKWLSFACLSAPLFIIANFGAQSVSAAEFRNGLCVPLEADRPGEDFGLGWYGPGVVLEAAGARCIPVGAGHGRRDAADVGATRWLMEWIGRVCMRMGARGTRLRGSVRF
jgi:hypothetical protein